MIWKLKHKTQMRVAVMRYDSLNIGTYNFMFKKEIKFYNLSSCRTGGGSETGSIDTQKTLK